MKFSENWLRQLVDIPATHAELTHRLTMCGLEVEATEALKTAQAALGVAVDASGRVAGGVRAEDVLEALERRRREVT